jgi:integrase
MGSIYRRTSILCTTCNTRLLRVKDRARCEKAGHQLKERQSPIWWIGYKTADGWQHESSRSRHKIDAQRLLRDKEGSVDRGAPAGRLTFDDAAKAAIQDYKMHKRRSLDVFERRITKHLTPAFTGRQLAEITTPTIRGFIESRQAAHASNAEINRELDCLSKMFKLAIQDGRLYVRPHIPKLKESAARKGFVTDDEYRAIAEKLEAHMRGIWAFLFLTGWRATEALDLRWEHVLDTVIRFTEQTKADEPARTIPITAALRQLLDNQKLQIGPVKTPWVFTFFAVTPKGQTRKVKAGQQISYNGWLNAFKDARAAAKVRTDLIPHDCRRTAIDRMERIGIARSTAMAMVGHKTTSVCLRYAISATLADAGEQLNSVAAPVVS